MEKKRLRKYTADSNFALGVQIYQSKTTLTQLDPLPESLGFEIVSKTIGRGSYAAYGLFSPFPSSHNSPPPPPPSCASFTSLMCSASRKANPIKGSLL